MITAASIVLVLGCSLGWSLLDLTRKSLVEKIAPLPLLFFVTAGTLPLFGYWVVTGDPADPSMGALPLGYWAPSGASILLNVVANLAFFHAIRISPLSLTIPLLSFTPVFASVLAMPLLGQVPSARQWAGIGIVVAGAFILSCLPGDGAASEGASPRAVGRAFVREPGALWMLLVAFLWAATISLDTMAVERSSPAVHGFILSAGVAVAALIALAAARRLSELATAKRAPWTLLAALAIGAVALLLQLEAIQVVWVGAVETVKRGLGNVMAVLFGRLFFGERVTPQTVIAVLMMAVGVAVLLL